MNKICKKCGKEYETNNKAVCYHCEKLLYEMLDAENDLIEIMEKQSIDDYLGVDEDRRLKKYIWPYTPDGKKILEPVSL